MVDEVLARIRVERETVHVTNATLCAPLPEATDAQRRKAAECCRPRLDMELAQFPERPVLALGAVAAQGFCGQKFSITQMAGTYWEVDCGGVRPVVPSVHPAAILRGGAGTGAHAVDLLFWLLCYDADKVARIGRGSQILFSDDIEISVDDPDKAHALLEGIAQDARKAGYVAVDTETYVDDPKRRSALQTEHAKLRAIGFATRERAVSVSWEMLSARSVQLIADLLADSAVSTTFHNATYDIPVLARHGVHVQGHVDDTLLLHHNVFPGLAHDLQRVTSQFFAVKPWKAEFRKGADTDENLLTYNALDTLATARVQEPLTILVKQTDAERTYASDLAMARAAILMTQVGVPISYDVNARLRTQFTRNVIKTRGEIEDRACDPVLRDELLDRIAVEQAGRIRKKDSMDFDERVRVRRKHLNGVKKPFQFKIGSGEHIVAFLGACGVPLTIRTDKGRVSTRKDILESMGHHPAVRSLLTYRENEKLLSTFVERLFDREYASGKTIAGFCDENDRCHPRWSVHKITGRWGSESPSCFDGQTEILTPSGWVRFDALTDDAEVAQFSAKTNEISFVRPSQRQVYPYRGEMVHITGRYVDLCVTPDHRLLLERRSGRRDDVLAGDFVPNGERSTLHAGQYVFGEQAWTQDEITFLCAAQADGWWQTSGWGFGLKRSRKIERICATLDRLGLSYNRYEKTGKNPFKEGELFTTTRIYVHACELGSRIHAQLGKQKAYGSWLLQLTAASIQYFVDEIVFWDGNYTRGGDFYSSNIDSASWVQTVLALSTHRTMVYAYQGSPLQTKINWQVRFQDRYRCATKGTTVSRVSYDDFVYCVTVPESYVVVRRNNCITVVGNCQNWPKDDAKKGRPNLREQVVAPEGRAFVGFDVAQLEMKLIALISGDPFLLQIFRENKDIHLEFAKVVWPSYPWDVYLDLKKLAKQFNDDTAAAQAAHPLLSWDIYREAKVRRDMIKRPEYGAAYAGSIETLWRSVVRDYPTVKLQDIGKMVAVMQSKMPGVAAWHRDCILRAERDREIRSIILGRRRCFPIGNADPTDAINFSIQSSGADLMNLGLADILPQLPHEAYPILQIHDAVVFECDEDDADRVRDLVVECFTQAVEYRGNELTFNIDCRIGQDWASL